MSEIVYIVGKSGIGKTTSIRTLDPRETFLVMTVDKRLPFKGAHSSYNLLKKEENGNWNNGNVFISDKAESIEKVLSYVDSKRPEIKNLVIDDFQYCMSNEFMRSATDEKKKDSVFEKYNTIASNAWKIIAKVRTLRQDLTVFIMSHTVVDKCGYNAPVTIGRMLGEKAQYEGYFELVLHAIKKGGSYEFLTNATDKYMAKSPLGMFEDDFIPNDLNYVKQKMNEYYYGNTNENGEENVQ